MCWKIYDFRGRTLHHWQFKQGISYLKFLPWTAGFLFKHEHKLLSLKIKLIHCIRRSIIREKVEDPDTKISRFDDICIYGSCDIPIQGTSYDVTQSLSNDVNWQHWIRSEKNSRNELMNNYFKCLWNTNNKNSGS